MDAVLRQALLGDVLQGSRGARYRLAELLGESRKGIHFRATTIVQGADPLTFRVTVLGPDVLQNAAVLGFTQEAEKQRAALGLLSATSRELVNLHDHGVHVVPHEGAALSLGFVVREEVAGQSLAKVIAAHGGFGLPVARARRLAGHVARGLFALHEVGVVHRDLTPTNVVLVQENGQERAKLVDYALSAALAPRAIEPSSIGYAPPERLGWLSAPIGPATDVFSFAVILFEALSGTEAFLRGDPVEVATQMIQGERPSLARLRATLPAELRDKPELVAALDRELGRATRPAAEQRHASIREFWAALEPLLREIVRPAASGGGAAVEDPVSFDGILPRSSSSPEIHARTPPPSVAMPASAARSGPAPLAAPMPDWQRVAAAISGDKLHAALVVEDGSALVAVGGRGVYRLVRGAWSQVPLPAGLDPRALRGLSRLPSGELLLFGEGGFYGALTARGAFRKMTSPDRDVVWLGACSDERGSVLVGERSSRPSGVVLVLPTEGKPLFWAYEGASRLSAAARLGGGVVVVVGTEGALATVDERGLRAVPWGRTGHLHAITRAPSGAAFAVGSGGHALRVEARGAEVVATLEGVQTTRDLFHVAADAQTGAAWAAGGDARLLERRGDVWVRVPLDPSVASTLVRVFPSASKVMVLAEDGALFSHVLAHNSA